MSYRVSLCLLALLPFASPAPAVFEVLEPANGAP